MPEASCSGKHRAQDTGRNDVHWLKTSATSIKRAAAFCISYAALCGLPGAAHADDCAPEPQGDGRIAAVIDARTLRLDDGRAIRLAGLAPLSGVQAVAAADVLAALSVGRTVSLHGDGDAPDRYGRQRAWVYAAGDDASLQARLVAAGGGFRDRVADTGCRRALERAEKTAEKAGLGLWAAPLAIKNAESPDDISSEIGHFTVVEGRVRSVRQSGGTTYLNFGRRWVEGFAVVVPARAMPVFDAAGLPLRGLEGKRLRVRGYVMRRGGPRIEALGPEQIDVVGGGAVVTTETRD